MSHPNPYLTNARRLALAIVLSACTSCLPLIAQSITVGPFVQNPTTTAMTVEYITNGLADGLVKYGVEGSRLEQEVRATLHAQIPSTKAYVYFARLTGLKPGTRYNYQVLPEGTALTGTSVQSFRTFPAKADAVTFIVYSDTQMNITAHARVASHFLAHDPAFILHGGDLTDKGSNYNLYPPFFAGVANIIDRVPMMIAAGNHDEGPANLLPLFDLPEGRTYYSFDYGPVHIVMLDAFHEGPEVLEWLDRDLAASQAPWRVAVYHTPTFNFAGYGSSEHRQTFLPLFVRHGMDVVFAGHSHVYERFKPLVADAAAGRVIQFITTGPAGGKLRPVVPNPVMAKTATMYAYFVVTVAVEKLQVGVYDDSGALFDSFAIGKKGGRYDQAYLDQAIPMEEALKVLPPTERKAAKAATSKP